MMRLVKFGLGIAGAFLASGSARAADAHQADGGHPVIELRQYKLVPGTREAFISLFDSTFVESQESVGMRLIGQFRDEEWTNRFTWIREFPSMADRQKALESFYSGPVWQAHRGTANPMLDDNDNVLLLRSARPNSGFGPSAARATIGVPAAAGRSGIVIAVIEYLWKDPNQGFSSYFLDEVAPALNASGLPILGAYVPEEQPNNFARLPVRQGEKIFVWFTRADSVKRFDKLVDNAVHSARWRSAAGSKLADYREREPQILKLEPTTRSALR